MKYAWYSLFLVVLIALPSQATIKYVPGDVETIQEAIDACAIIGDTVLIAPGTYHEELLITGKSITICSEYVLANDTTFRDNTILDGMDSFRLITMVGNHTHTLRLIGFSIRHGNSSQYDPSYGGGLRAVAATVYLDQVIFRHNYALTGSAAHLDSCDVQITSCQIDSNSTPFNYYTVRITHGSGLISSTSFRGNQGGGLYATRYHGTLEESNFLGNGRPNGGGGALLSGGVWYISHNYFYSNTARFGGGLSISSMDTLIISENVFDSNYSFAEPDQVDGVGGAMDLIHGYYNRIEKNIFINNLASEGGAIYSNGNVTIEENIFSGNSSKRVGALFVSSINGVPITTHFIRNLVTNNSYDPTLPGVPILDWDGVVFVRGGSTLYASENDFIDNHASAAVTPDLRLHLQNNYWGDPTGPYNPTANPDGLGDTVLVNLPTFVEPWSTEHFWAANVEPDTNLVDFGMVGVGESVGRSMVLTNTGVEALVVYGGLVEDEAFSLELGADSLVLARDETAEVTVRFTAPDDQVRSDTLRFDCNDPEAFRETVILRANQTESLIDHPDRGELPQKFEVSSAQPNPFNPSTTVTVALPHAGRLRLEVFDLLGRRVALLANTDTPSGSHRFTFDATHFPSGLYLLRASSPEFGTRMQKVVLLK